MHKRLSCERSAADLGIATLAMPRLSHYRYAAIELGDMDVPQHHTKSFAETPRWGGNRRSSKPKLEGRNDISALIFVT